MFVFACMVSHATTYTYDANHRLTKVDYGNGFSVVYTYDAAGNMTAIKESKITSCSMTVTNSGKGTVTPKGTSTVAYNKAQSMTATPAKGNAFTQWTASPSDNVTFADATTANTTASLTGDATITANFAKVINLTLAVADGGGTTTPTADSVTKIPKGTPYAITATAASGKVFAFWKLKGKGTVTDKYDSSTTVMLEGNCTVTANFADPVTLTMAVSGHGSTDPAVGTHTVAKDNLVPVTATADEGFNFTDWTGSGTFTDSAAADTTVTLTADGTVTANFEIGIASITATNNPGAYKTGDIIILEVLFGDLVNVTGTPQLKLNSGTTAYAYYKSGSGTETLIFTYTIQDGENSNALDYSSTTALELNGGTVIDANSKDVTLTLPPPGAANSIAADKTIIIDTTSPTITAGIVSSDNTYVDVVFNEGVYNTSNGFGALEITDFTLAFTANANKAASAVTITKLTDIAGEVLSGGEKIIRMKLTITGTPKGTETIEIQPVDGNSVFDLVGNVAPATTSTGSLSLGIKVTVGSLFTVAASEVTAITSGEFTRRPFVYSKYYDPIKDPDKLKEKSSKSKVLTKIDTNTGVKTEVEVCWQTKVKLLDYTAFKLGYKTGITCTDFLGTNPISQLGCALYVKTKENDIAIDSSIGRQLLLAPPYISITTNPYDNSEELNQGHANGLIDVHGVMFGIKAPKAWLEYKYDKNGVVAVKALRCKAIKLFYANAKGKINASAMNINTGVSKIRIKLPKKFPDTWDNTSSSHDLVLDNGIGLASVTFYTKPLSENTEPIATDDTGTVSTPDELRKGILIDVLGNDYDADGDPLQITLPLKVTNAGALISVKKQLILYKPAKGATTGTDSFTYTITDNIGTPVEATVTVTVK